LNPANGRDEILIFAFKDDSILPEVYRWTGKNDFFVYIDGKIRGHWNRKGTLKKAPLPPLTPSAPLL
jgi:hypothetical protein